MTFFVHESFRAAHPPLSLPCPAMLSTWHAVSVHAAENDSGAHEYIVYSFYDWQADDLQYSSTLQTRLTSKRFHQKEKIFNFFRTCT